MAKNSLVKGSTLTDEVPGDRLFAHDTIVIATAAFAALGTILVCNLFFKRFSYEINQDTNLGAITDRKRTALGNEYLIAGVWYTESGIDSAQNAA